MNLFSFLLDAPNFTPNFTSEQERYVQQPAKPVFFVHFNKLTLAISSITTRAEPHPEEDCTEIDEELGSNLIIGTDNVLHYMIIRLKTGIHELIKRSTLEQTISSRVDVVDLIYEVKRPETKSIVIPPITFEVDESSDSVTINYDGDKIKKVNEPIKFYLTRFDDPSFLKCSFSLDVNILDTILAQNELEEWPNPIILKVNNVRDLSIYGIKGQLRAEIK